jgi:hypothetical protein
MHTPMNAARAGGYARIQQIAPHYFPGIVAQGFERAYLGALLVHHAVHGGDAHQRGHQEEEYGEDLGHVLHYL